MPFPILPSNSASGYFLTKSLRFRASATAYLSRTISSNGSATTFTYSTWAKRGILGAAQDFGIEARVDGSNNIEMRFDSNDTLAFLAFNGGSFVLNFATTQVFRDPSAWYHIIIAVDTTQATSTNRVKIYVNGSQITAFSTATYPSINATTYMSQTSATHNIGRWPSPTQYFDGYLAETNFIDGQALTPSSFGSTNALTGVWQPARYTGTYGTNGFYLPFTNNSTTTTLGNDFSGNGNNWTTNNFSLTAGATYDSMTDVPTLTSATTANYCVLNPLNSPSTTVSNGNLTLVTAVSGLNHSFATIAIPTSGKWYWEYVGTVNGNQAYCGISNDARNKNVIYYGDTGEKYVDGAVSSYGAAYGNNDVIGVAVNVDAGNVTFYKNNTSQGAITYTLTNDTFFPWFADGTGGSATTFQVNFGQQPFTYTPPTGFVALNTFNLPNSTIVAGNKQMNATTYTGNGTGLGSTQTISNGIFQPDFIWIKSRSTADYHNLNDIVRGIVGTGSPSLFTNTTDAETTFTGYGVSALTSTGFTLIGNGSYTNANGVPYVGWQWKANGTAVTNTAGSISSQVSANTTSGFSIVTYTGTGANATVGHGLGVAPSMIIAKSRSNTADWDVYHASLGATQVIYLNRTTAAQTNSAFWNNTAPTSTAFSLGNGTDINASGATNVAYCWAPIAGFSKFGSYTGNGSTDGTFVYTGFRTKFIMIKASSFSTASTVWTLFDTSRSPYNASVNELYANLSSAEGVDSSGIDILSNGFKPRRNSEYANSSGQTYIYMAFAENPFKNALAR